jgi:hypothetical protein
VEPVVPTVTATNITIGTPILPRPAAGETGFCVDIESNRVYACFVKYYWWEPESGEEGEMLAHVYVSELSTIYEDCLFSVHEDYLFSSCDDAKNCLVEIGSKENL